MVFLICNQMIKLHALLVFRTLESVGTVQYQTIITFHNCNKMNKNYFSRL